MGRNILLLVASVLVSALLGVAALRWLAPELFGGGKRLTLVKSSHEVPPFYDNIFRPSDYASGEFLISDPVVVFRAKPLLGPAPGMGNHDLLGFRNRAIPNLADVVIIGDSQTYGNNVSLEQNWPSAMADRFGNKSVSVYAMATGGWGAVQYLDIFTKATVFQPIVMVVAFYTGNDPLESFNVAYASDRWVDLRPDKNLTADDAPRVKFPAPIKEQWQAQPRAGFTTVFTPQLRLASNQDHPAVHAGYGVMWRVVEEIERLAATRGVKVFYTIIPTKEYVYGPQLSEKPGVPEAYLNLLSKEAERIDWLREKIESRAEGRYIDLVAPLRTAAAVRNDLYPRDANGHPLAGGYAVIGDTVAGAIEATLPPERHGLYLVKKAGSGYALVLVSDDGYRRFKNEDLAEANGWPPGELDVLSGRELAKYPWRGVIDDVNPGEYGPPDPH